MVKSFSLFSKGVLRWNWWKLMPMIKSTNPCSNGLKGVLIKEKALYFAKEFFFENFQASDSSLDKWKKRLGLFFLFQALLLYHYSNLGSLSLKISMNFSSVINNNRDGTLIRKPSFWLTALPWTIIWQLFYLAAFRK